MASRLPHHPVCALGRRLRRALSLVLLLPLATRLSAQQLPYVSESAGEGRFPLAEAGRVVPLVLAPGEPAGVPRAVEDLRVDLERVTGMRPELLARAAGTAVLIGTLGRSELIDRLAREGKLDVSALAGRRETFLLQVLETPLPGVERALVIAGSDRRGTIYGVYELSREIGVSPWYWWGDVPVPRRESLYVAPGARTRGEPAVRYRGIFINDEAPALSGWSAEKFGGFNHRFYQHVFELILRLGGNFLWPAMWGNAFYDDDPENARLAHEYGVVIGTSHHEPLMRAHDEWRRYGGGGAWNYQTNDSSLRAFWREGIRRMGDYESVITLAMRGDGDEPMSREANIELLERIVRDQRRIIAEVTGRPLAETPQVWALYKEVQEYYDRGMRVPDDVTLLFADDNWGNIRRLPDIGAPPRAGGYGVYYHFDYVGGPRNYKWLNTNPIQRTWEQMTLAWSLGVDRIWIVNVGDIKPMEFPISFFLDLAWNPRMEAAALPEYTRRWATEQFGAEQAGGIAEVITTYLKYAGRRKPELLSPATFSLAHYREFERVVADYRALAGRAHLYGDRLPAAYRDAYYQLVRHPIEASANLYDLYYTVALNRLHAAQGRATAGPLAARARRLFARDAEITAFYNDTLAGGRWRHLMDQTHISYTYWQQPPRDTMPLVHEPALPEAADMGVAIEGSAAWWPNSADSAVLPAIDPYLRRGRSIELFNRGSQPFEFTVEADGAPWLQVAPVRGRVSDEQRIMVGVDWDRAPGGTHRVPVRIRGAGREVVVIAVLENPASPRPAAVNGFVEGNGYVAMEAEHYERAVAGGPVRWVRVPDMGRTLSAMTVRPVTVPSVETPGGDSPRLEYRLHVFDPGPVTVSAYLSPTLDYNAPPGLRYAISFDDEPPQLVDMQADTTNRTWERGVAENIRVFTTRHTLDRAGEHILRFWLVDPGVVLQRLVVDTGGLRPSYLGPPESYYRRAAGNAGRE